MELSRAAVRGAVRSNAERVAVWILALALVGASAGTWYVTTPLHGNDASIETVRTDERVELTHRNGVYALEPVGENPTAGLVFYPGGRVHPDAYLAALAPLAAQADVAVYIPEMPLGFAVLNPDAAEEVVGSRSRIEQWFVGGHSLGGAMACRYADGHPEQVDGLVLFAAYCESDATPADPTLSVTGSADTVLDRETYQARRSNLPTEAMVVEIREMNHSEFGSCTGQRGDRQAPIGYRTAHDRLAGVVIPWFENLTEGNRTAGQSSSRGAFSAARRPGTRTPPRGARDRARPGLQDGVRRRHPRARRRERCSRRDRRRTRDGRSRAS